MTQRIPLSDPHLTHAFERMPLIELSEFVKGFEKTLGVTSAATVAVDLDPRRAQPGAGSTGSDEEFDVVLTSVGDRKIAVIKEVRVLTSLGLKEAKDLVEATVETKIGRYADRESAERAAASLRAVGAQAIVRPLPGDPGGGPGYAASMPPARPTQYPTSITESLAAAAVQVLQRLDSEDGRLNAWAGGSGSRELGMVRLAALMEVSVAFCSLWDDRLFHDWFFLPNMHLDGAAPSDVLTSGDTRLVVRALEDAAYGVYA